MGQNGYFLSKKMSKDSSIIETINIAIKSQEEIRAQLLSEIAQLEAQNGPQKVQNGSIRFYKTSLERVKREREELEQQIEQIKSNDIPQLQQKLNRVEQKSETIKYRIDYLQKIRDSDLTRKLDNPEIAREALTQFTNSLNEEIKTLEKTEQEYTTKIAAAKQELHTLQEANLKKQRSAAQSEWKTELSDEMKLNQRLLPPPLTRRRSKTLSDRLSKVKSVTLPEPPVF